MKHFEIGKQLIEDLPFDAYTSDEVTRREAMSHLAVAQTDALIGIARSLVNLTELLEGNPEIDRATYALEGILQVLVKDDGYVIPGME